MRYKSQQIDQMTVSMQNAIEKMLLTLNHKVLLLSNIVEMNDMGRPLKKGFALIKQNSNFVTRKKNYNPENPAIIKFYDGEVKIK
jgi:exonuclease VII large subunit